MQPPHTMQHFLYHSPMPVRWIQCDHDDWCPLNSVRLTHSHFDTMEGVYIIWHGGRESAVVAVGQGIVREELAAARRDQAIQSFRRFGLYVTWASIAERYRDGVVAYLAGYYRPKVARSVPDAEQIAVELP